jgi:hypothetical protein
MGLSYREIAERKQRAGNADNIGTRLSGDDATPLPLKSAHGKSRTLKKGSAKTGADKK